MLFYLQTRQKIEDWEVNNETLKVLPQEIASLVKEKKTHCRFYGGFASWLDYELIRKSRNEFSRMSSCDDRLRL